MSRDRRLARKLVKTQIAVNKSEKNTNRATTGAVVLGAVAAHRMGKAAQQEQWQAEAEQKFAVAQQAQQPALPPRVPLDPQCPFHYPHGWHGDPASGRQCGGRA